MQDGPDSYPDTQPESPCLTQEERINLMAKSLDEIFLLIKLPFAEFARNRQLIDEKLNDLFAHFNAIMSDFTPKERAVYDLGNHLNSGNPVEVARFTALARAGLEFRSKQYNIAEFYKANITDIIKLLDIFIQKPSVECLLELLKKSSLSPMANFTESESKSFRQVENFCASFHLAVVQQLNDILTYGNDCLLTHAKPRMAAFLRTFVAFYTFPQHNLDVGVN